MFLKVERVRCMLDMRVQRRRHRLDETDCAARVVLEVRDGNLIGLGRLMAFVAEQSGVQVGALTVVSTHACADQPRDAQKRQTSVAEIKALLTACDALVTD
jgi:hypothetical protein